MNKKSSLFILMGIFLLNLLYSQNRHPVTVKKNEKERPTSTLEDLYLCNPELIRTLLASTIRIRSYLIPKSLDSWYVDQITATEKTYLKERIKSIYNADSGIQFLADFTFTKNTFSFTNTWTGLQLKFKSPQNQESTKLFRIRIEKNEKDLGLSQVFIEEESAPNEWTRRCTEGTTPLEAPLVKSIIKEHFHNDPLAYHPLTDERENNKIKAIVFK